MNRAKLFVENFFVYGFISILNKFVPLVLLPVITRLLPNPSDFGIFNIYSLIVGFGSPLAILGLYDAMFREYFEKDDFQYKYNVTTTAQRAVLTSSIIISILLVVFSKNLSFLFFKNSNFNNIILYGSIGVFLSANLSIFQAPTRINNERKVFVFSSLFSTLFNYFISMLLIYLGFSFLGLIYGSILSSVLLILFFFLKNKEYFSRGRFDKKILLELLKIGLPLLPTFLIYWIYSSMDRIMISNILGISALGIYSVGSKIANISQLIYISFANGWQYFVFSTMKDEDQVALISKIFEYLGVISFISFVIFYPFNSIIFRLFFKGEYVNGYIVAPYLYLSPLLLMLFQIIGNQFLVIKKSYLVTLILSVGALANIVLNLFLIPILGIEGAALSTLLGYTISLILIVISGEKYKVFNPSRKFLFITFLFVVYLIFNRILFNDIKFYQFLFSIILFLIQIYFYKGEIKEILNKLKRN